MHGQQNIKKKVTVVLTVG